MADLASPVDGTRLAYDLSAVEREGVPVVLLHGSVLSKAIWRGLGYLVPLSAEHPVLRLDLRGHGRSGKPHDPAAYTPDVLVADLLAVLDDAGIERAALVGYSLGARIALTTALRHPDRVTHLVSLGGSAAAQHDALETVFFPGVVDALRTGGMEEFCARQGLGPTIADPRHAATRQAFLAADPLAMAALFEATAATAGVEDEALSRCPIPALWMAGDRDHPRFEETRHAAATMPEARFAPLPGRTHGSTLSPAGPVLDEVLPFLRER